MSIQDVAGETKRSLAPSIFDSIHDSTMSRVPEVGYDSFYQWLKPSWNIIIVLFIALASSTLLSAAWFSVVFSNPTNVESLMQPDFDWANTTDPNHIAMYTSQIEVQASMNLIIQCMVIFFSLILVRFCFVKFTGEAQDPFLLISAGFSEMILHPKYRAEGFSKDITNRLTVLVKILIILIGELIGWIIGYCIFIGWARNVATNDSFPTENCTAVNFTSAPCRVYAKFDESVVSDSAATWMVVLGMLFSFVSYYIGYTMIRHKEHWMTVDMVSKTSKKNPKHRGVNPFGFAMVSALGPTLSHFLFARYVGVSHNTFYWLVSAMFTHGTEQAKVYAWPGILIGLIVVLAHFVYHLLWVVGRKEKRTKYQTL